MQDSWYVFQVNKQFQKLRARNTGSETLKCVGIFKVNFGPPLGYRPQRTTNNPVLESLDVNFDETYFAVALQKCVKLDHWNNFHSALKL